MTEAFYEDLILVITPFQRQENKGFCDLYLVLQFSLLGLLSNSPFFFALQLIV